MVGVSGFSVSVGFLVVERQPFCVGPVWADRSCDTMGHRDKLGLPARSYSL